MTAPSTPRPEDDPPIADASWLADDETRSSTPEPAPSEAGPSDLSGYEVEGVEEPGAEPESPTPAPVPRAAAPPPRARPRAEVPARAIDPEEAVRQVWSRGAEWGPDLARLGVVAAITAALVWLLFDFANPAPWLLVLLLGLVALLALSYPLVVTLERPIRMTPEQAVKDYYGALSHHVPHFRRMWLLLSHEGRSSGEYGSFEGFRRYWKRRLAELRGDRVPSTTPLVFEAREFRSDRSAGKPTATARFTMDVFARGNRSGTPLASIPVSCSFVRGPDNQWYLDRGTLPDPPRPG